MSEKRSISYQRQCVEHLIAHCPDVSETIVDGAKQACLTIGWIERRVDLLRMLDKLQRERPDLAAAMSVIATAFPGVEISDIREAAE